MQKGLKARGLKTLACNDADHTVLVALDADPQGVNTLHSLTLRQWLCSHHTHMQYSEKQKRTKNSSCITEHFAHS